MLMPVPATISAHQDYVDIFGREAPFCVFESKNTHRKRISIFHQQCVYEVSAWKPFIYENSAQATAATLERTRIERENQKKIGTDEKKT